MKTKPYDELYRRQHRIVGHYLALQAWLRGVDCVVLDRHDLQALFHITNTGEDRIKQFKADTKPWFRIFKPFYPKTSRTFIRTLFLSRVDLNPDVIKGLMTTDQRITKMKTADGNLKIERFSSWYTSSSIPKEADMVSDLVAYATGLKHPTLSKEQL
jgi:hypothetical protein